MEKIKEWVDIWLFHTGKKEVRVTPEQYRHLRELLIDEIGPINFGETVTDAIATEVVVCRNLTDEQQEWWDRFFVV